MHLKLLRNRITTHLIVLLIGVAMAWVAMPIWRQAVMFANQSEYGALVEKCDVAMRDHLQARQRSAQRSSDDVGSELYSAEVGLLICQDYDLYQKRLMQWGLRENELAKMRLLAVEERSTDLEEVVATHEIRF
ncbi:MULTISPECIES: TIGR03982 family His-Xaa-Ser system protein [Sphingomonadaceae]|nr:MULTISPECIES: TIGR03982 family His-Xaa-Ser system protein [unclassified Sphingorhabdus]ASK87170.1 TIGR03982: His-Xaa-Ser system protein [Sphingorhabdus sp. SMR4y]VWX62284.1 conserved hypothetical protein [Sphingorhabdus sp. 109]|tara:strand:- start:3014 stop:3412 length:399 start_codon:yes stop_codon:yes gene_type:complete